MSSKKSDIQTKMTELEAIVDWFESEDVDIDEALIKYEKGLLLAKELNSDMKTIQNKFTKLQKSFSEEE